MRSLPSFAALALLSIGFAAFAAEQSPQPFELSGTGTPTVLFEAGAGEQRDTWSKVLPDVSKLTRTFAYTRRGYRGLPVLEHRDAVTIVEELRTLLAEQHIAPPYVLVGHSIGGLYMQVFAKTHPEEVAGVVLVDTTTPDQFERMKTEQPSSYRLARTALVLLAAKTDGAEMRGIEESQQQWHAAGPFPAVPMILLSASRDTSFQGHEFTQFIQGLQRELVAQWPGAELRMVDSNHFVQRKRPGDVVQAIKDVLVAGSSH